MIANKDSASMKDWVAVPDLKNPTHFIGTVSNHPRQAEFHGLVQRTSRVVSFDPVNGLLETQNTIYRLVGPHAGE